MNLLNTGGFRIHQTLILGTSQW